jgi:hypothetical protein
MAGTGQRGLTSCGGRRRSVRSMKRRVVTMMQPHGRIAGALPNPVEIAVRTRPPLRHAFIAWSPRSRLRQHRLDYNRGLHRRFSSRPDAGAVNGAVSSFLETYIGIANGGDLRFCRPRLF